MSWVLMRVVILYSWVISCTSSSITNEVFGSNPEFGSSQNKYCGFKAMARAMATRFCIPPLISPGNLSFASARFTRSRQNMARRVRSRNVSLLNMFKGNITLSSTVMESNNAALWNIIPISRRNAFFSFLPMARKLRLSYNNSPRSGVSNPTIHFINTVFPEPLCPMMRLVFPFSKVALISFNTSLPSNDFQSPFSSIIPLRV